MNANARKRGTPNVDPSAANRRVDGKRATANVPTAANASEANANASNGDRRETNTTKTTWTKNPNIGKTSAVRVRAVGVDKSGKRRCFNL